MYRTQKNPMISTGILLSRIQIRIAKWRDLWEKSRRILNVELSSPHPVESEHILLPTQEYNHQPEWSIEFWCPEFLLGYHYIGMIE